MLTNILRVIETRSLKPLKFNRDNLGAIDTEIEELGIYIHIPFCKVLCPFCPYNKEVYNENLALEFKESLISEIKLVGSEYSKKKINSIYFGGGTPSLLIDYLPEIVSVLKEVFIINCSMGIELHPNDINKEILLEIKRIGFTMISIGIQSFNEDNLKKLGRRNISSKEVLKLVSDIGFHVIDVDLIFGIEGQTSESLKDDFRIAFDNGATQVSTYPFIDFSYANNVTLPLSRKDKKSLLNSLEEVEKELDLERTSVWTFGRKGIPKYSSITRDSYIGFGPSAASLTNSYFKINTFSVKEYINAVNNGKNPKALTMNFTLRVRGLYWFFWNAYTLELNSRVFKELFNLEIEDMFSMELKLGRLMGLITKEPFGYKLTKRGSYIYHLLEQHYTHQYIDKTWKLCGKDPWPEDIKLY